MRTRARSSYEPEVLRPLAEKSSVQTVLSESLKEGSQETFLQKAADSFLLKEQIDRSDEKKEIKIAIEDDHDICIVGPPGGLKTSLLKWAVAATGALLVWLSCARVRTGIGFTATALEGLERTIEKIQKEREENIKNKKDKDSKSKTINYPSIEIDDLKLEAIRKEVHDKIIDLRKRWEDPEKAPDNESFYDEFTREIDFFVEKCKELTGSKIIVCIERIREMRRWDDSFGQKGYEKYFRETIFNDDSSSNKRRISYIVLDVSEEAAKDPASKGKTNYKNCDVIMLHPLNPEATKYWISDNEMLGKQFDLSQIDSWFKDFYDATQGNSGEILSVVRRMKDSIEDGAVITREDIRLVLYEMKLELSAMSEALINILSSKQLLVLFALSKERTKTPYSASYCKKWGLSNKGGTLRSAIQSLQNKGLIRRNADGEYGLALGLLSSWLSERTDSFGHFYFNYPDI